MFIKIEDLTKNIRYINVFKIIEISLEQVISYGEVTLIRYESGAGMLCINTEEKLEDFIKRLKKEVEDSDDFIKSRFDILDL